MKLREELCTGGALLRSETVGLISAQFCCQAWLRSLFPTCASWQSPQRRCLLVAG